MNDIDFELLELETCTAKQLKARWHQVMRCPAPDIGPDVLRRTISYKLQERVHGKLPRSTATAIAKIEKHLPRKGEVRTATPQLKPGTRLTRSWHGKMHQVLVCEDGLEFEGRSYNSLSQIAQKITGTHWSGPRFFGLAKGKADQGG